MAKIFHQVDDGLLGLVVGKPLDGDGRRAHVAAPWIKH